MTKHTPGPWKAIEPNESGFSVTQTPVLYDDEWLIVTDSFVDTGSDEVEANARLIAAAPDMCAALTEKLPCTLSNATFADDLETIARAVDLAGFDVTAADLMQKAQQIRAAINKATGKETGIPAIDEALSKRPLTVEEARESIQRQTQAFVQGDPNDHVGWIYTSQTTDFGENERPTIVCLCGSTRFSEAFQKANIKETLAGRIVLTIGCDMRSDDALGLGPDTKAMLDELHLRKIDLADEVLILNVGGYIGESTRRELEYAEGLGKRVRYLEEEPAPAAFQNIPIVMFPPDSHDKE